MVDSKVNEVRPYLASERSRIKGQEIKPIADGSYNVLTTLIYGETSYRVFAELQVQNGGAHLRFYRFDLPGTEEWFAERKFKLAVPRPELVPLEHKVNGVEFLLCPAIRLDEIKAGVIFGPLGPPAR